MSEPLGARIESNHAGDLFPLPDLEFFWKFREHLNPCFGGREVIHWY